MNPEGQKDARTFTPEIKFLKSWLDVNDRDLASVLTMLALEKRAAWCFLYTKSPIKVDGVYAKLHIDEHQLFAILDGQEIDILSAAAE